MTDNDPLREKSLSLSESNKLPSAEIPERISPGWLENIISVLLTNPILGGLSEETLRDMSRLIFKIRIPAHTVIFHQGDSAQTFYIIHTGKVRVFRKGDAGPDIDLAHMGPGECFGVMSLLTGNRRMRSVETLEDTDLLIIEKQDFDRIIKENPHLFTAFMKHLTDIIEQVDLKLEDEASSKYRVPAMSAFDFIVIILLSLFIGVGFNFTNPFGVRITPVFFHEEGIPKETFSLAAEKHTNSAALFVDARPPQFFAQQRIKGAKNIPSALFDIMYLMNFSGIDKEQEIIVYGRTMSSLYDQYVAKRLVLRGHKNTKILQGGLDLWKSRGYPVEP